METEVTGFGVGTPAPLILGRGFEYLLPSLKNEEKNTYLSEVLRLVREYEVPGMLPGMK